MLFGYWNSGVITLMWIDKGEGLEMKSHYTISKEDFCEEYEMPMAIGPVEKRFF